MLNIAFSLFIGIFIQHLSAERVSYRTVDKDEFEKHRQDFDVVPWTDKVYANVKTLGN
ncbi:MAG: hypothetical protein LBT58_01645 [Endomicrobium sp.]|jgi:hypothetical protein|nr:hypothetical protein [Endomicrobium sp.]